MLNARQLAFRDRPDPTCLDHINYLSAPVGSGKTAAIINEIKDQQDQFYIFVSPTQVLAREIKSRLDEALVNNGQGQNVFLLTTEAIEPRPILQTAIEYIVNPNSPPHTLIITTEAFRRLLPRIADPDKARYAVFMDEGIDAIDYVELKTERQTVFMEPIHHEDDGSLSINEGHFDLLQAVSFGQAASFNREELNVPAYVDIAGFLTSDIHDVYASIGEGSIRVVAFLRPDHFMHFRSVTILMAIFEQSLLCLFWREKYNITFQRYETEYELYDTHVNKGPQIIIQHLLHAGDNASSLNLKRNWQTGEQNAPERSGLRVIDRMAVILNQELDETDIPYCWSANGYFENENEQLIPQNRMPVNSAGLNQYRHFATVVSLISMNPPPWVKNMVLDQIQISDEELYALWKLSYTYQTIGRCALRRRDFNDEIRLIVLSDDCATRLANLFEGATIIGQLGDIPHFGAMRRGRGPARSGIRLSGAQRQAWSRYRKANPESTLSREEWYEANYNS